MKLNYIEDEPKSIILEFEDSDRSLPEIIKSRLVENKDVEFAGVVKDHPDIAKPRLIVRSSKNVKAILAKAVEQLQDDIKELALSLPKK